MLTTYVNEMSTYRHKFSYKGDKRCIKSHNLLTLFQFRLMIRSWRFINKHHVKLLISHLVVSREDIALSWKLLRKYYCFDASAIIVILQTLLKILYRDLSAPMMNPHNGPPSLALSPIELFWIWIWSHLNYLKLLYISFSTCRVSIDARDFVFYCEINLLRSKTNVWESRGDITWFWKQITEGW